MRRLVIKLSAQNRALYDQFRADLDAAAAPHMGQTLPLPAHYAHYLEPLDKALTAALKGLPSGSSAHFEHSFDDDGNRILQIVALVAEGSKLSNDSRALTEGQLLP